MNVGATTCPRPDKFYYSALFPICMNQIKERSSRPKPSIKALDKKPVKKFRAFAPLLQEILLDKQIRFDLLFWTLI
jgi:hypothetical protein